MKKILGLFAILAVIVLGVMWHQHRARARALNSGDVYVREQPSGPAKPLAPPAQSPTTDEIATSATPQPPAPAPTAQPAPAPAQAPAQPNSDSIPRNPPNGLAFAGSGKFQLYRQGDITWRLNTQTGDACILFATDAQWRLHRVYQAGCGTHGETTMATGD